MFRTLAVVAATTLALPAVAADLTATGDAAAGEKAFRQCVSCHVVVNDEGETLAGKSGKSGPNLFGIIGNKFGQVDGFRYSDINQIAAADDSVIVNEEVFVAYVQDPTAYLREATGDKGRSKMTFKVRKEEDALNLYAYLASIATNPDAAN
ncbi:c-type cytochrome [Tateyamaria sp.]|uniref:c-type cytochrome n=1 Tax=Tateyamaria sp. TaxID=1929288 RepID=UPI00329FB87A